MARRASSSACLRPPFAIAASFALSTLPAPLATMVIGSLGGRASSSRFGQAPSWRMTLEMNDERIMVASAGTVAETAERLKAVLDEKNIELFADIDHAAGAARADLALRPTRLLVFGDAGRERR